MLEKLDSINWANIHHSHGTAEQFPQWIRDLTSTNQEIRELALREIVGYSHHQGSNYDVTPYVVPFIIELIQDDMVPDRHNLLDLLKWYVGGSSWILDETKIQLHKQSLRWLTETRIQEYFALTKDVYNQMIKALPSIIHALRTGDPQIRLSAFRALLAYHLDQYTTTLPELVNALTVETDAKNQWYMTLDLADLLDLSPYPNVEQKRGFVPPLQKLVGPDFPKRVRYQAAIRLTMALENETPPDIVNMLVNGIGDKKAHSTGFSWTFEIENACRALTKIPHERAVSALMTILPRAIYPDDAQRIAITLLDLVFYEKFREIYPIGIELDRVDPILYYDDRPSNYLKEMEDNSHVEFHIFWPSSIQERERTQERERKITRIYQKTETPLNIATLTDEQRQALKAVVETDFVWMLHSNLMEIYGLPAERSKVRALLES